MTSRRQFPQRTALCIVSITPMLYKVGQTQGPYIFTVRNVVAARQCFYTCLSFCPQSGGRQTPPRQTPSWQADTCWLADTPPPLEGGHPTLEADTPWQADTSPRQADTPGTATAADGTHPNGMHSCY